jgi:cell division protein FtsL
MAKRRKSGRKISEVMQRIARKKRIRQIAFLTILILVATIFITGSRGTLQLYKFNKQKNDLENEIESLETEKTKLEKMKSSLESDPEYIEKIAREKYKMKKKEEKVYEIVEE